jgi:hypothetical protein
MPLAPYDGCGAWDPSPKVVEKNENFRKLSLEGRKAWDLR